MVGWPGEPTVVLIAGFGIPNVVNKDFNVFVESDTTETTTVATNLQVRP